MLEYVAAIKRGFRDRYHFGPVGGTPDEPFFAEGQIPDGAYPPGVSARARTMFYGATSPVPGARARIKTGMQSPVPSARARTTVAYRLHIADRHD